MCGIAGKVVLGPSAAGVDAHVVRQMTDVLCHRGPDAGGVWTDAVAGLGSRRLAVIDLDPRSHQPMSDAATGVHIAYNGEVYNYRELRQLLAADGVPLRTESDTEVILQLYLKEGRAMLARLRGMFAFAIWDPRMRQLLLARDRVGKKPLYYRHAGGTLWFASEPKAILQDPDVPCTANAAGIDEYLSFGYVPAPLSAFSGFARLEPGHLGLFDASGFRTEQYWRLRYAPKTTASEADLVRELEHHLDEAIRLRMISDVPLGALLSGGLDSSLIVALMARAGTGRVKTFSIGFQSADYDELRFARLVAKHVGTDHHEEVVSPDATALLPRIVWHYDEPYADSSALPSFLVSELARRHVTVALTGDGGDECFVGYDRYAAAQVMTRLNRLPAFARRPLAAAAPLFRDARPKSRRYAVYRFLEAAGLDPVSQYVSWIRVFDADEKRRLYTSEFVQTTGCRDPFTRISALVNESDSPDPVERLVDVDVRQYLPDDLLVKMDIASMAHSLEVRSPFLDQHVMEFAARLPIGLKLRRLRGKHMLRQVARKWLPPEILQRRKMGFGVPIAEWFRGSLKSMAHDILLSRRSVERGYFRQATIERYLDEHTSGRASHHTQLWALLMLELWHHTFVDRRPAVPSAVTGVVGGP